MPTLEERLDAFEKRLTRVETRRRRFLQVGLILSVRGLVDYERSQLTVRAITAIFEEATRGVSTVLRDRAMPNVEILISIIDNATLADLQGPGGISRIPPAAVPFAEAANQLRHYRQALALTQRFLGYSNPIGWAVNIGTTVVFSGIRGLPRNVAFIDRDTPAAEIGLAEVILLGERRTIRNVGITTTMTLMRPDRYGVPFFVPPIVPFQRNFAYERPNNYQPEPHIPSTGDTVLVLGDGHNYTILGTMPRIRSLDDDLLNAEDFDLTEEEVKRILDA